MVNWHAVSNIEAKRFTCGYCDSLVASSSGFFDKNGTSHRIYICPNCSRPSYFVRDEQMPGIAPGRKVSAVPKSIESLYEESRKSTAAGSYTAAVLVSRKLLMNIAVNLGAEDNLKFIDYVDYLAKKGYVPPNGHDWVDHIRKKGNEATHEIVLMSSDDAAELIIFSEMLLKFIYEFPARVPKTVTK